jgi:hypothetical protein
MLDENSFLYLHISSVIALFHVAQYIRLCCNRHNKSVNAPVINGSLELSNVVRGSYLDEWSSGTTRVDPFRVHSAFEDSWAGWNPSEKQSIKSSGSDMTFALKRLPQKSHFRFKINKHLKNTSFKDQGRICISKSQGSNLYGYYFSIHSL